MKLKISLLFLPLLSFSVISATAADKSPKDVVAELNKAFEAAFAKADVPAVTSMFTEDVRYVPEDGSVVRGQQELKAVMEETFRANPGRKLEIETREVKELGENVLLEDGVTKVTNKDGTVSESQFTAVYTKNSDKWKITDLVETPLPALTAADYLSELSWLIGTWEETDPANDISVSSRYSLANGGSYISRNVVVKRAGKPTLEGWQIIGWDPVQERIRSWTFDSEGGYSDGLWTRNGNAWLVREIGFAPDGSRNTSDITMKRLDNDRFTWESNNRTLDGEPQPSLDRIEIRRVKGN